MKTRIKNDSLVARKSGEKEKALALTTLIAEIERSKPEIKNGDKVWSDAQCISAIKKTIDGNEQCGNTSENVYLSTYLPKLMTTEELTTLIENHIKSEIIEIALSVSFWVPDNVPKKTNGSLSYG